MKKPLLIAAAAVSLFVFRGNYLKEATIHELFPLTEEMEYMYNSSLGEVEATVYQEDDFHILEYESMVLTLRQKIKITESGVHAVSTETETVFGSTELIYDPWLPRYKFPAEAGDKWSYKGVEYIDEDTVGLTIDYKVLGRETIEVEAGKFDCLVVYTRVENDAGSVDHMTEWLSEGVGIVRTHAYTEGDAQSFTYMIQELLGIEKVVFELKEYE